MNWHTYSIKELSNFLDLNNDLGLSLDEHSSRIEKYGLNELKAQRKKEAWQILWDQVSSVMILVLIGAVCVKLLLQEWIEAISIFLIVILNVLLGFFQEYKAEKAMVALQKMSSPVVRVKRNGLIEEVDASSLVPGDLIYLEAGNLIAADARLIEAAYLRVQEASLTGESVPVEKNIADLSDLELPLGDRFNMVYRGTSVVNGRGTAVVVQTGMHTELGKIANLIQSVETEQTPLQKRISHLSILLAVAVLVVILLMVGVSFIQQDDPFEMLMAGVAIAVAAIPEGLPAVMTITLALGAQRMLGRKALIRKLPAVETLGSITTICSDKTGTLTQNKMHVVVLDACGDSIEVKAQPLLEKSYQRLLWIAGLCNDGLLKFTEDNIVPESIGDPTETAILYSLHDLSISKDELESRYLRVAEVPFDSDRKRMSTLHSFNKEDSLFAFLNDSNYVVMTKGAADGLLEHSTFVLQNESVEPMTCEMKKSILESVNRYSKEGLRVLGVTCRGLQEKPRSVDSESIEQDLIFVGLICMIDPPRPEVKLAVEKCLQAGIRPVMITGDHPLTALAIAKQLGIANDQSKVLTGHDLAHYDQYELESCVEEIAVFARVSPEHKLNIVNALQAKGHVVAMTGDGVNDAPALRKSNVGVAMGITGTDVSKEAADMIILDDNFTTIVDAIEEGRTIYDNVRKFVKYIVTSNSAEVVVMFVIQLLGMPLPMTTLQILWMNLVTDGIPGLALGLEPTERDTMYRKPFAPNESIFSRGIGRHILIMGFVLAATALGVGLYAYHQNDPAWRTMIFMTLTVSQLGQAIAIRSNYESVFKIGLKGNPLLLWAALVTLCLQMMIIYVPDFQKLFGTVPLSVSQLTFCMVASTSVFWAVEIEKWFLRRYSFLRI